MNTGPLDDEINDALKHVRPTAEAAGISFERIVSITNAAQRATMRDGAVIGSALKTIIMRLSDPIFLSFLETYNVDVKCDVLGRMRNLGMAYSSLTNWQRDFIVTELGGIYQVNIVRAIAKSL